jgi:hypothetical protein
MGGDDFPMLNFTVADAIRNFINFVSSMNPADVECMPFMVSGASGILSKDLPPADTLMQSPQLRLLSKNTNLPF